MLKFFVIKDWIEDYIWSFKETVQFYMHVILAYSYNHDSKITENIYPNIEKSWGNKW